MRASGPPPLFFEKPDAFFEWGFKSLWPRSRYANDSENWVSSGASVSLSNSSR